MDQNDKYFKAGPKWLKDAFFNIYQYIETQKPISGIGTMVSDSPGGRVVSATGMVGGSLNGAFPFQCLSSANNIGIAPFSSVFKSLAFDKLTISGLLSDVKNKSDAGWFNCPEIGQKIWLQIGTCASTGAAPRPLEATADTTTIQNGTVGGGGLWDEYPDPVSINIDDPANPFQEFYNVLIAEVTDPEIDTRPALMTIAVGPTDSPEMRQITQCWSENILLTKWAISGLVCLVPADPTLDYPPSAI